MSKMYVEFTKIRVRVPETFVKNSVIYLTSLLTKLKYDKGENTEIAFGNISQTREAF